MRNVHSLLLLLLVTSSVQDVCAQYFQYSQYNFTQQRINPAQIGLTRYASAAMDYRNQRTGGDFSINSNFLSLAYPLLLSSTGQPWGGLGIALHNDQSSGIFRTQEAAVSYAVHIRLSRWQTLSLGIKGLHQSRRISYDGYYTGSQYIPNRGFDLSSSSGENFAEIRSSFRTISLGGHWQEVDKRGRILKQLGFSLFDFNKPKDSFLDGVSTLSSTFVANGSIEGYSNGDIHVFPEGLLTYSASKAMLNTGVRIQKELNPKSKLLSDRVEVLAKYAVGRSGIVGIQLHRENFSMGLSYDFPILRTNAGNVGALEVALELRKLVVTRGQKLLARRKKEAEQKRQLQAKKVATETKPRSQAGVKSVPEEGPIAAKPDSTLLTPLVERMQTTDTATTVVTSAQAGSLKQEPLLIEKVTLHFPFEFNSSDLDESAERFLEDLTITLKENELLKVRIVGHTDDIGSDKFNVHLSHKRAEAVKRHLIMMGIPDTQITSEGKGEREPLSENLTEEGRARNRRVEILIYH